MHRVSTAPVSSDPNPRRDCVDWGCIYLQTCQSVTLWHVCAPVAGAKDPGPWWHCMPRLHSLGLHFSQAGWNSADGYCLSESWVDGVSLSTAMPGVTAAGVRQHGSSRTNSAPGSSTNSFCPERAKASSNVKGGEELEHRWGPCRRNGAFADGI